MAVHNFLYYFSAVSLKNLLTNSGRYDILMTVQKEFKTDSKKFKNILTNNKKCAIIQTMNETRNFHLGWLRKYLTNSENVL